MLRWVLIVLGGIIGITLLRGVIGLLGQSLRQVIDPPKEPPASKAPTIEQTQCPTCGSWVAKK